MDGSRVLWVVIGRSDVAVIIVIVIVAMIVSRHVKLYILVDKECDASRWHDSDKVGYQTGLISTARLRMPNVSYPL